ncbi:MAG: protease pro-enzyme activation domain-containing protein, partial [Candidatus Eremiobacteraeota bacterium]|nr:protease pro-enzyme activation domain-containing protein [Candidatus Eremiobacteraeota bacterium]
VVSRLREAGFSITQQYSNAMLVEAEAPASTVARYFGTSLHDYMQAGRGTRFANVTTLTIPAAIAAYVQGIVSDDLVTASHGPLRLTPLF